MSWLGAAFRLARRELFAYGRQSVLHAATLAIGLCGIVALDALRAVVERALAERSRSFLAADLSISSPKPFTPSEVAVLDRLLGPAREEVQQVELYSMAAAGARSRLVEIRAVSGPFPLAGEIVLDGDRRVGDTERRRLGEAPRVWVDPELRAQIGADKEGSIRLGEATFTVDGVVERDAGRSGRGFTVAPRVTIALAWLDSTELTGAKSRVTYRRLVRIAAASDPEELAVRLRGELGRVDGSSARVATARNASRELARALDFLAGFLGLTSLVGLLLAAVAAAYLFRNRVDERTGEIAVLVAMGVAPARAQVVLAIELMLLGAAASVLALVLAAGLLPLASALVAELLPVPVEPRIGVRSAGFALLLGSAASLAGGLPFLSRMRRLRAAELFREGAAPKLAASRHELPAWLPALGLSGALVSAEAWSAQSALVFVGSLGAAAVVFRAAASGLIRLVVVAGVNGPVAFRLAARSLARRPVATSAAFAALAFAALASNVVPGIRAVLVADLDVGERSEHPSLFLFDVQEDQIEGLEDIVAARGLALLQRSPMVRARLVAVNGARPGAAASASETEAAEGGEARARDRGYNLTYRPALSASEQLIEGRPFTPGGHSPKGPAAISLEEDFASRVGLTLGDRLVFDVQGVPVEGEVVNLRRVRWTSFLPNFFVLFEPGPLEPAPKTFLAAIPPLPTMEAKNQLQAEIVARFPNASIVDVERVVARIVDTIGQVERAMQVMSLATLLAALALVAAIARRHAEETRVETNLLKVLGARPEMLRSSVDLAFGGLALAAAAAGVLASVAVVAMLARYVFDVPWRASPVAAAAALAGLPLLVTALARRATSRTLRERPLALLRAGG